MTFGKCKLTNKNGNFVKSHIIPKAFLKRTTNAPFMISNGISKPSIMYDGWYDKNLVIREGEDYFEQGDSYIAKILQKNYLTYSKRRAADDLNKLEGTLVAGNIYKLTDVDTDLIRLFAQSLLWRASMSTHKDFTTVNLDKKSNELLKTNILNANPGPYWEFPI